MKQIVLAAAIILSPVIAVADDKIDCTDPQVQMEMNYCAGEAYKAADARLNAVYKKAMAAMKQIDGYLDEDQRGAADALREAQRAWIPFRDKACEAEGYLVSGGSMQPLIIYECLTKLTGQRIGQLNFLVEGMGN